MKKLQRNCFLASGLLHGLLLVVVLVGSAFIPDKPPEVTDTFMLVSFPDMIVDEPNIAGGGNPKAGLPNIEPPPQQQAPPQTQPQPAQPPPQQATPPPPVKQPDPVPENKPEPKAHVPEPVQTKAPEPEPPKFNFDDAVNKKRPQKEAEPKSKPERPQSSFDLGKAERKVITPAAKSSAPSTPAQDNTARQQQFAAAAAGAAVERMQKGLSSGVGEIGVPGPGGPAYASYNLVIKKIYEDAWITPQAAADNEPIVQTEIILRGDGTVISSRITKKSNKRELDQSVQRTLDRVSKTKLPPFPSGNADEKRTFKINFNLSSKLNLG